MSCHLLVLSDDGSGDSEADDVLATVEPEGAFRVARCGSPGELIRTVATAALAGGVIDTLDLFAHGGPGHLWMGNEVLFEHGGGGLPMARWLRPYLTPDARVRLLGCKTALGEEGRGLLLGLQREIGGGIVVYGTVTRVTVEEFHERGFDEDLSALFLFSSTEAVTRPAPDLTGRALEIQAWVRTVEAQLSMSPAAMAAHTGSRS